MTFYFLILFALYFVLLILLRIGWSNAMAQKEVRQMNKDYFISIVVPVRNEKKNIGPLLQSLSSQSYPSSNFEVIIVDDHSTDDSVERCNGQLENLTVLSLSEGENGKKAALTQGICAAKGEIIATTDADCLLPADWLTIFNNVFQDDRIKLAAGMVAIKGGTNYFSQWQAMEFASVMGTGVAAFGLNKPLMCNGANLSFRKEAFWQVKGYEGNDHIASGDDEFLMRKIQDKFPHSVQMANAIVVTQPQVSLKDFLDQRIRWASKWKGNPSITAKLLAAFILLLQASWIFLFLSFLSDLSNTLLLIVMTKLTVDLLFLWPVFRLMKIKFRPLPLLGLQFLYPFYVIFVGLLAPWKSYRWKDRKIL
jgi:cellulose synthase/poly-beta-1,6-N-acetylglucosamine synthase-like glycosyltransferase